MLRELRKFYQLLGKRERARLFLLFCVIALTSVVEIFGLAFVLPFLQLAAAPNAVEENVWVGKLYDFFGFESSRSMLLIFGSLVVLLLGTSNLLSALGVLLRERIAASMDHHISMRLVRTYTQMPYHFFLNNDAATLVKKVCTDVRDLVSGLLVAGTQLLCQLIVSAAIIGLLVFMQPGVAIAALAISGSVYVFIYLKKRRFMQDIAQERLQVNTERLRSFVDLIYGIKAITSDGAKDWFVSRHEHWSLRASRLKPKVAFVSAAPRYLVESLAFGGVVCVTMYLVAVQDNFVDSLPMLILFTLAGYRLIPAMNAIYTGLTTVASAYPAISYIYDDLYRTMEQWETSEEDVGFADCITLNDVSFQYANSEELVVRDVDLAIPKGSKIGLVGPSGSGKTTLFDLMMGLLSPTAGQLQVDGVSIGPANCRSWQDKIGYVPQEVFLYDDSVLKNVAFGSDEIDVRRVEDCCRLAHIDQHIREQLPDAYETMLGEGGAD